MQVLRVFAHHYVLYTVRILYQMRFVCQVMALVFTLLSSVEIFGGPFVLYRGLNLLTLLCLWFACRPRNVVVSHETEFEGIEPEGFSESDFDDVELVDVESTEEFSDVDLNESAQLPCV